MIYEREKNLIKTNSVRKLNKIKLKNFLKSYFLEFLYDNTYMW